MEQDEPGEALTELRERRLGALELLQAAVGSGLAAYAVWALLLQPGFRRVPLRLQVRGPGAAPRGQRGVGAGCRWGRAPAPRQEAPEAGSAPSLPAPPCDSGLGTQPRLPPCPGALCRCE